MTRDNLYLELSKFDTADLEAMADELNASLCRMMKLEDVDELTLKLEIVQSILRERDNGAK